MENGTEWDNGQAIHKSCGQTMHAETHTCILFRWRAASTGEKKRKRRRLRPYCMFPKGNRASSVQPGHRLWGCQIKGLEVVTVSSWAPQFVYTVDKLTRIFWESVCLLSRGSSWKTGMLVCCIRRGGATSEQRLWERGSNLDNLLFGTSAESFCSWCNAVLLTLDVSEGWFWPHLAGFNKDDFSQKR